MGIYEAAGGGGVTVQVLKFLGGKLARQRHVPGSHRQLIDIRHQHSGSHQADYHDGHGHQNLN
jgi:hypothetical protein